MASTLTNVPTITKNVPYTVHLQEHFPYYRQQMNVKLWAEKCDRKVVMILLEIRIIR